MTGSRFHRMSRHPAPVTERLRVLRRLLLPLACTAAFTAAAVLLPVAGHARSSDGWTNEAASRFWTPERMADSMPASGRPAAPPARPGALGTLPAEGAAVHFAGIPTVGMLFSVGGDMTAHFCSASVIDSPGRDLILTAAHCELGTDIGFVPDYRAGATRQPYGIWAVSQVFTDPHWTPDDDTGSDYDFAFARVRPGPHGQRVEDVTGANKLARTPGYSIRVTVMGYPHAEDNPADQAVTCTTTTGPLPGLHQMQMACGGFYTGTSGGPWIIDYNTRTRSGTVVGLIGGLGGGGPDDRISYSPFFDDAVLALYHTAVRAQTGATHPAIAGAKTP
ncbi:trypsin-like serine peptidase [Actinacidiphila acididurans]|nr:trypsin-like serine protease [Actinacidiphila acididurans]